ncbi:MAG TPA: efflux RND transporter periplasmic adaptor subunit [Bryobacteraceae bacterium]|nr:efflux RND transporter periplasmic adaptor subunit [Bryobacteraceae bacterium]
MQTPINDRTEEKLLAEIEDLKRKLQEQHREGPHPHGAHRRSRPSSAALWILAVVTTLVLAGAFFAGYLPQASRQTALAKEAREDSAALPPVNVAAVEQASGKSQLILPGNIQAVTEAPVLARASGYIKTRLADIGDRVKEGQLLAEIDAGELDQQVRQAKATVDQANSSLEQATANLQEGRTNTEMARLTYERWNSLVQKGAVSRQDADTYKSQFQALGENVQSLEKAVNAAKSNITAAEANLGRLTEIQGYLKVRAPFAGVITLRNVDTGALVSEGSTLLFRMAQTDRLRTYVNVPQADSTSIRIGQAADLKIPDLPSKTFKGTVTRTANALDPATRTLLAEVQVSNEGALLLPGMYAEVNFTTPRQEPPLIIRADALVVRGDGPHVAIVGDDGVVHFKTVQVGRDYGDKIEILGGIEKGVQVVISPGDVVRENTKVHPILIKAKAPQG